MPTNKMISYFIGSIAALLLFFYISPILTPFFIASLLAYLCDPIVKRLMSYKIPRILAVITVFIFIFSTVLLILFLLIPILENQLFALINHLPQLFTWLEQKALPWLNEKFDLGFYLNIDSIQKMILKNWDQAGNIATHFIKVLTHSGYSIFLFSLNLILIPVVTFYLLRDWDKILLSAKKLIPRTWQPSFLKLVNDCNDVIGAFFRGQLLVMLFLALYYITTLTIINLPYSILIGLFIGLVAIVPYLGFTLGLLSAAVIAYSQNHDWIYLSYVILIFVIGHVLESYILSPKLVGGRIGLHPVAVIFSILAGGQLFGFVGVLFALPSAAVIMVLIKFFLERYFASQFYQG